MSGPSEPSRPMRAPAVRPGATVGVFAPASPVRLPFLEAGEEQLRRLGLTPKRAPRALRRAEYTAGTPKDRAADFRSLLRDDEVSALFAARGGYGSLDLVSRIAPMELRVHPKIIVGSSDATALLAVARMAGLPGLYGPMVAQQIARGPEAFDGEELLGLLGATEPGFRLPWGNASFLHPGAAEGVLAGGCLSLLAALEGTDYAPRFAGSIAFFEDVSVKPYQLERMFWQFERSGAFAGIEGVVFGQMPGCVQHPDQGYALPDLLRRWTEHFQVPVVFGFAAGHVSPDGEDRRCRALPLGVRARMDEDGLTLLEGVVR